MGEFSGDQLEDGIAVFMFDVSVFVYLLVNIQVFFFSGFCSWYLFFLHQGILFLQLNTPIKKYFYCIVILCLFACCSFISSFVFWSLRTNNSLSKISTVFLLSGFLFCILLFWSALNKLSEIWKYIWNIPHVTQSRSCTLSSTIHIFTKSLSLSFLPKAWIKWKKIVAESLKASSSFFDKFLQALRLNLIFTSVTLSSAFYIWLVPKRIFSINFLLSWIIKLFKPLTPNESKKKISVFGSMSSTLHQWVSFLLELSVFTTTNGYFPFFWKIRNMINKFFHMVWRKSPHKIIIYIIVINISKNFFILKITNPINHFFNQKDYLYKFFCFCACFLHYVVSNVRFKNFSSFYF